MLTVAHKPELKAPEACAADFLQRFRAPARLLLALSGGSDSTAMLIAFHAALRGTAAEGHELCAVTVDHGLRPDAKAEAAAVARLCADLQIPHRICLWAGAKPQARLQATAREARYRLLRQVAVDMKASAVLLGHTRDDQIETVAMRQARLDPRQPVSAGLAGMAAATLYDEDCWLLRPFLGQSRSDLQAYLSDQRIAWIDDPSNRDERFERVRVRLAKRPYRLEGRHIALAALHRESRASAIADLIGAFGRNWLNVLFCLDRRWPQCETELAAHALAELTALAGGRAFLPGREQIERLHAFLDAGKPGRLSIGRAIVDIRRDTVFTYRDNRDLPDCLLQPGERTVWDGRFVIENRDPQSALRISAAGEVQHAAVPACDERIPQALRRRAGASLPVICRAGEGVDGQAQPTASVQRRIPRHDTFLPAFDLKLADAVASLVARPSYGKAPVYRD